MLYYGRIYNPSSTERMILNQNDQRQQEINHRLVDFQRSTQTIIEPVIKMRPVSTRRDIFPCVERRRMNEEEIQQPHYFTLSTIFSAGNDFAPHSGFCVDAESKLQKRNNKTDEYIPDSSSDLYKSPVIQGRNEKQTNLLWESHDKYTTIPRFIQQEKLVFHNESRLRPFSLD